mmetsp:Transcript_47864/g.101703  ORF Transcript_47864/g.101703 Transcript_47864/m.101703 type:complete len:145 (+) Transcript_47864:784-1218(+)
MYSVESFERKESGNGSSHAHEPTWNAVAEPSTLPINMTAGSCSAPSNRPAIDGGQAGQVQKLKSPDPKSHMGSLMTSSNRLGTSDFHGTRLSNAAHPARQTIPKIRVSVVGEDLPIASSAYTSRQGPNGPLLSTRRWMESANIP